MQTYSGDLVKLPHNSIFIFGSNTQGRHGKGAAKVALDYFGAIYGQARGLQGQSYAICTKDLTKYNHPSVKDSNIRSEILDLYQFARKNKHLVFYVAYKGSGKNLNGYSPKQMADMFSFWNHLGGIPENFVFEEEFSKLVLNVEN